MLQSLLFNLLALSLLTPGSLLLGVSATPGRTSLSKRANAQVINDCVVSNTVALTFDDGPTQYIPEILETLAKYNATATFFLNGNNQGCIYEQTTNLPTIQRIVKAGHQVASHTWSHPHLTSLSWDDMHHQMWLMEEAFSKMIGAIPAMLRAPYGEYNDQVLKAAGDPARAYSLIHWSYDAADAYSEDGKTGFNDVLNRFKAYIQTKPQKFLSLQHDHVGYTAKLLDGIIPLLQARKYKLVTVAECTGRPAYRKPINLNFKPKPDNTWTCAGKPAPPPPS